MPLLRPGEYPVPSCQRPPSPHSAAMAACYGNSLLDHHDPRAADVLDPGEGRFRIALSL